MKYQQALFLYISLYLLLPTAVYAKNVTIPTTASITQATHITSGDTNSTLMRDPTQPANNKTIETIPLSGRVNLTISDNNLALTAIFSAPHHKLAIINGQMLRIGQKIGSFTIDSIDRSYVIVRNKEGKLMHLSPRPKQQPVKSAAKE